MEVAGWGETKGGGQLWDGISSRHQADVTSAIAALFIQPASLSLTSDTLWHLSYFPRQATTPCCDIRDHWFFCLRGQGARSQLEPYQPESLPRSSVDCKTTVVAFLYDHLFQMETKIDPIKLCLAQLYLRSLLTKWLDIKIDLIFLAKAPTCLA